MPVILAHTNTVTRSFALFVPVHVSRLNEWVLSGNNHQYSPISSALNISFGSYLLRIGWSVCRFRSSHNSLSTAAFSPLILLYAILWCFFHPLNHPLAQVHESEWSNSLLSSSAFAFRISPLTRTDWAHAAVNHWKRASSTLGWVDSLWRFFLELPMAEEAHNFSLSLRIVLRVFWEIPNSETISFFFFQEVANPLDQLFLAFF